jgi:transcriptional regulator of NAD metabolism
MLHRSEAPAVKHQPLVSRCLGYRAVQVLGYVRETIADEGVAPSYGMIAAELDINGRHKVCKIVQSLERRGLLSRAGSGRVRRIRLSR